MVLCDTVYSTLSKKYKIKNYDTQQKLFKVKSKFAYSFRRIICQMHPILYSGIVKDKKQYKNIHLFDGFYKYIIMKILNRQDKLIFTKSET